MSKPTGLETIWASSGAKIEPDTIKKELGWITEIPPYQYFNYIFNKYDLALDNLNTWGMLEWDIATTYYKGSHVIESGVEYVCNVTTSIGINPSLLTDWIYPDAVVRTHTTIITTQTEFDTYFTGTLSGSYYLKNNGTPYVLSTLVYYSSGTIINSDGATINLGTNTAGFGTMGVQIKNIEFTGFILDGKCGVTTYDGIFIRTTPLILLSLITHSKFTCEVRNSNFGGYDGSLTSNYLTIENVHDCTNLANGGGGVSNISYSEIKNIYNCSANSGGGVYLCENCNISNIYACTSTLQGGGISKSSYSTISRVYNCVAGDDGGGVDDSDHCTMSDISYCTSTDNGGGVYDCNYCTISNISYCVAGDDGGGVDNVSYCNISNISNCEAGDEGGGAKSLSYCTVSDIYNCTAVVSGGGCSYGAYCVYLGAFHNNVAPSYDNLAECQNSIAFCNDELNTLVATTRTTLNWN